MKLIKNTFKKYKVKIFFLLTFFLIFISGHSKILSNELDVIDLISRNDNLTTFYKYLKKTGLDNVLKGKSPWDWTVFAPSNKAFNHIPSILKNEVLVNNFLSQSLFLDHILAKNKTSSNVNTSSEEITLSKKKIKLYNTSHLFVKDMIVKKKDLLATNGVVHIINCIMFVQPSLEDDRLTENIKKKFPITSCCMEKNYEVSLWKSNLKLN